jgi:hypothetical protein
MKRVMVVSDFSTFRFMKGRVALALTDRSVFVQLDGIPTIMKFEQKELLVIPD